MRALLLIATGLLVGCAMFRGAERAPEPDTVPSHGVVERIRHVFLPRPCGKLKREWLQGQAKEKKAEGVVAEAQAVAEARGKQVDTLNGRVTAGNTNLTKIESVLKKYGCGEIEP